MKNPKNLQLFTILGKLFDIFQMNRLLKTTTCQNRNSEILLEKKCLTIYNEAKYFLNLHKKKYYAENKYATRENLWSHCKHTNLA